MKFQPTFAVALLAIIGMVTSASADDFYVSFSDFGDGNATTNTTAELTVGDSGSAYVWIQDGQVTVNGEIETRRRKQIFLGDVVETMGQRVTLDESFFDC